jgi:hypothetical protein
MKISAALEIVPGVQAKTNRRIGSTKPERLALRPGMSIVCLDGRLWVTQEGDAVDHILEAGERFEVASHGALIISAFGQADYLIA